MPRRTNDVTYFTHDAAHELEGLRRGGPGWWLRGEGETRDPARRRPNVLTTSERSKVCGYDLVVAAPRPISALLAIDPYHARGVMDAHRASVRVAIDYLEDRAVVVRERRKGHVSGALGALGARRRLHSWRQSTRRTPLARPRVGGCPTRPVNAMSWTRGLSTRTPTPPTRCIAPHCDTNSPRALRGVRGARSKASSVSLTSTKGIGRCGRDTTRERGEKLSWSRDDTIRSWTSDLARFEPLGVVEAPSRGRRVLDEHRFAGAFEGRYGVARRHVVEAWANAATFGQDPRELIHQIDVLYPRAREFARRVRDHDVRSRRSFARRGARTRPAAARERSIPTLARALARHLART